ncbi:MAG: ABC transporter ATP-binding protein [Planctomycetota bacterium]|nr:ABC transporter ATP-binding protein [Planctomycetota bacterium]
MSNPAIAVEDLHKTYGSGSRAVVALEAVNLAVAAGEIYGLLGCNGAGKTTLVKILLDIVRPTRGRTTVLGVSTRSAAARRPVGYLPEDHRFPDYRSGAGLLDYYAALSGVNAQTRRKRIPELLKLTGLADAAQRKVRTYSKGMKQRLGVAQALVHEPRVLFLDEPTDGVDPVGRAHIRDILRQLKGQGMTIFLNSHLLSEVERLCDRVGILEKGKLVREGTLEALTRGAILFALTTVPPLDEALRQALLEIAVSARQVAGGCEVELRSDADLDRVIDLLRARGVSIRSVASKRLSLEDVFLQAVDKGAGGPAVHHEAHEDHEKGTTPPSPSSSS